MIFASHLRKSLKPRQIFATFQKLTNQCFHSWRGFAEGVYRLFHLQFCNSRAQWKKHCVEKVLLAIWETFLHENNRNYNCYKFSCKFCFHPPFHLSYKPKKRIWFSASWWCGNEKYFCFLFIVSRALLQSHTEFNRIL